MVYQNTYINTEKDITDLGENNDVITPAGAGVLHDGWLVAYDLLIQPTVSSSGANAIGILGVNIKTHPLTGAKIEGSDYGDLFEDYLTDTNEMAFWHGGSEDMDFFYFLFNDVSMDNGTWTHLKKYFRKPINAGALLYERNDTRQLEGSAFTIGTFLLNSTLKQVNAPHRWNQWADTHLPLRFVGVMSGMDDDTEIMNINPPCLGYYTNISVQFIWPGSTLLNQARFVFGVNLGSIDLMGVDPATDGELYEYDAGPNHIDYLFGAPIDQEGNDLGLSHVIWKHFGHKRIEINEHDDLVTWQIRTDTSGFGAGDTILIQGDFVPYQGARWSKFQEQGTLTTTNNWNPFYQQHMSIREVMVNFILNITVGATEYAGAVYIRKFKSGQQFITDTIASGKGSGDILDEDLVDSSSWSLHGIIGRIPFDTENLDVATAEEKGMETLIQIPELENGDYLGYDLRIESGTLSGTVDMSFMILGSVTEFHYSKGGDFLEGSNILPADMLGMSSHDNK